MLSRANYSTVFVSVITACAKRSGAAARESLWRDRSGGFTQPVLHACGSVSPLRVCTHTALENIIRIISPRRLFGIVASQDSNYD